MITWEDKYLEEGAIKLHKENIDVSPELLMYASIAISLKRIADAIENSSGQISADISTACYNITQTIMRRG